MPVTYSRQLLLTLEPGLTLVVTADAASSGIVRRVLNNPAAAPTMREQKVPINSTKVFGPYPELRNYSVEVTTGKLTYTVDTLQYDYATERGNIEGFTGSFTLKSDDMGKIFRCDDSSNVTVTIPPDLVQGFNCGFTPWDTGTITIAAASGATNRSGKTALTTRYSAGSLLVMRNPIVAPATVGSTAEFVLAGDFT